MKKSFKILWFAVAIVFLIFYSSTANHLIQFIYLFFEAVLIASVVYGTIGLFVNSDFRNEFGKRVLLGQLALILLTHILRVFWLIDRDDAALQTGYFFKGYLLKNTLMIVGNSFLIACVVVMLLLILRLSRKMMRRVVALVTVVLMCISLLFYLYLNRDLSQNGIHVDYTIDNIEKMRQVAIDHQKTVYVDFWHSGCGPCLQEFSEHENFKKLVDEQKVHFLFIGADRSVPGEKQKQRILIEKYNLQGTHTFISKEGFSEILDNAGYDVRIHGYKAFPHHMIISPDGDILEVKADSPSPSLASRLNGID